MKPFGSTRQPLQIQTGVWSLTRINKPYIHILIILAIGLLAYSNTFHASFHFDDYSNITGNPLLRKLNNFWPPSGTRWFGMLTFAVGYQIHGFNVVGFHILNLIIHLVNAVLVYRLILLTFRTPFFFTMPTVAGGAHQAVHVRQSLMAFFTACLFVSHPIQTQAVTYIIQRLTSLAVLFYLLSLVMYVKARLGTNLSSGSPRRNGEHEYFKRAVFFCASLISAVLAMTTKEISFTLLVIVPLYDVLFFKGNKISDYKYCIAYLATLLVVPFVLLGLIKPFGEVIGAISAMNLETPMSRWAYLFTQFRVVVTYIRLLVLPVNQNIDYNYPISYSFFETGVILSFIFLSLLFGLGVYLFRRSRFNRGVVDQIARLAAFGIFWFFITLSIESSVIPIRDVIFEHRLYLPSVGALTALTASFFIMSDILKSKWPKIDKLVYAFLLFVIIIFTVAAFARNIVWVDEVSLWQDAVLKSAENPRAYHSLGVAYGSRGWYDKAIACYQRALALRPDPYEVMVIVNNLGNAYFNKGWVDAAINQFQLSLSFNSGYSEARINLGRAYLSKGMNDRAIEEFRHVLNLNPNHEEALSELGLAFSKVGETIP